MRQRAGVTRSLAQDRPDVTLVNVETDNEVVVGLGLQIGTGIANLHPGRTVVSLVDTNL